MMMIEREMRRLDCSVSTADEGEEDENKKN